MLMGANFKCIIKCSFLTYASLCGFFNIKAPTLWNAVQTCPWKYYKIFSIFLFFKHGWWLTAPGLQHLPMQKQFVLFLTVKYLKPGMCLRTNKLQWQLKSHRLYRALHYIYKNPQLDAIPFLACFLHSSRAEYVCFGVVDSVAFWLRCVCCVGLMPPVGGRPTSPEYVGCAHTLCMGICCVLRFACVCVRYAHLCVVPGW